MKPTVSENILQFVTDPNKFKEIQKEVARKDLDRGVLVLTKDDEGSEVVLAGPMSHWTATNRLAPILKPDREYETEAVTTYERLQRPKQKRGRKPKQQ